MLTEIAVLCRDMQHKVKCQGQIQQQNLKRELLGQCQYSRKERNIRNLARSSLVGLDMALRMALRPSTKALTKILPPMQANPSAAGSTGCLTAVAISKINPNISQLSNQLIISKHLKPLESLETFNYQITSDKSPLVKKNILGKMRIPNHRGPGD